MRANQIKDFKTVQIIGKEEKIGGSRQAKKVFLIFLAAIVAIFACSGYFFVSARLVAPKSYYMLILDVAPTIVNASEVSESIAKAGGSGFVLNDGQLKISAAVYRAKADAQSVLGRLVPDYPSAHIKTYSFKGKITHKQLKQPLDYPAELIDELIKKSMELDLAKTSEGEILLSLTNYRKKIDSHIKALQAFAADNPTASTPQAALEFYDKILNNWDYICSLEQDFGIYNHRIKYFLCLAVDCYADLRKIL